MKTGDELDLLVEAYVMGVPIEKTVLQIKIIDGEWVADGLVDVLRTDVPKYSTDMAEAWKVVERIKQLTPNVFPAREPWLSFSTKLFGVKMAYQALWNLNPELICKAALESLGYHDVGN